MDCGVRGLVWRCVVDRRGFDCAARSPYTIRNQLRDRHGGRGAPCSHSNDEASWPKISVIIPSLNQAHFLKEAIESVVDQHYPRYRLIVMDGGSTDESVDIIKSF